MPDWQWRIYPRGFVEADVQEVIISAVCKQVFPASCIVLVSLRDYTRSVILRILNPLDRDSTKGTENCDTYGNGGISLDSITPFVVKLTGVLSCHILAQFKGPGMSDKDILDRMASRSEWCGTVHQLYHHCAITDLMEASDLWGSVAWFVRALNGGYSIG